MGQRGGAHAPRVTRQPNALVKFRRLQNGKAKCGNNFEKPQSVHQAPGRNTWSPIVPQLAPTKARPPANALFSLPRCQRYHSKSISHTQVTMICPVCVARAAGLAEHGPAEASATDVPNSGIHQPQHTPCAGPHAVACANPLQGIANRVVVQNFQTHPEPRRVRQQVCATDQLPDMECVLPWQTCKGGSPKPVADPRTVQCMLALARGVCPNFSTIPEHRRAGQKV